MLLLHQISGMTRKEGHSAGQISSLHGLLGVKIVLFPSAAAVRKFCGGGNEKGRETRAIRQLAKMMLKLRLELSKLQNLCLLS